MSSAELDAWQRDPLLVDHSGAVIVRLRRGHAWLDVALAPVGSTPRTLVRATWADLSHGAFEGLDGRLARALVAALAARPDRLVALPHLGVAPSASGRSLEAADVERAARAAGMHVRAAAPEASLIRLTLVDGTSLSVGGDGPGLVVSHSLRVGASVWDDSAVHAASTLTAALVRLGAGSLALPTTRAIEPELAPHLFALRASGFTRVPGAIDAALVAGLRDAAECALARAVEVQRTSGQLLPQTIVEVHDPDTFVLNRALYCWSEACRTLLESTWIEQIATALMGPHRLHELAAQGAVPAPDVDPRRAERWHRDQDLPEVDGRVRFLWFMFPVDRFTADNGATWVVPGSHHLPDGALPPPVPSRFPTARQIPSEPGDLVVLNPLAIHTWGHNATTGPRRMINVMLCAPGIPTVLDHATIAGPGLLQAAGPRMRALIGEPSSTALERGWPALPVGWPT